MRNHGYLAVAAVLFLFSTPAGAVELGEINVGSHLGGAFHAEIPLALAEDEEISNLSVELAAPADYGMLKVHRNQALNMIRADIIRDSQGSRIVLSSRYRIDAPFFTLVLKVRYGRVTRYKKYPVILDSSSTARPLKAAAAEDVKQKPATSLMAEDSEGEASEGEYPEAGEKAVDKTSPAFKPFDGWARTSHYGPIVYGDSIYTIADRLRIDRRYTIRQVMVALFEKNRSRFAQENLNLVLYGTYLDVPMAQEVERLSYEQALAVIQDHNRRWRELTKQPRYAAVDEAQKTRYSKRVRVAEAIKAAKAASGMAAAPVSDQ